MLKRISILLLLAAFLISGKGYAATGGYGMAVIDAESGRLLFGTNPSARLPIASLTKIWTAFVVLENSDLKEKVEISNEAAMSEGSSIYLEAGETTTIETLLYGLMLRSGNDAAYALAEHVGGSIEGFVQLMNDAALLYGLTDTTFTNPSGLHNDKHLSSAYETARMLQIALSNEDFRKIATTLSYKADTVNGTTWSNKHKLLHRYEEAKAGKTGYTTVAGRTLATYFERDGVGCIVVTLNESDDWRVHVNAANRVWKEYESVKVASKGNYSISDNMVVSLREPIRVLLNEKEKNTVRNVLQLPRERNEKSKGIWHVFVGSERIYSTSVLIRE